MSTRQQRAADILRLYNEWLEACAEAKAAEAAYDASVKGTGLQHWAETGEALPAFWDTPAYRPLKDAKWAAIRAWHEAERAADWDARAAMLIHYDVPDWEWKRGHSTTPAVNLRASVHTFLDVGDIYDSLVEAGPEEFGAIIHSLNWEQVCAVVLKLAPSGKSVEWSAALRSAISKKV